MEYCRTNVVKSNETRSIQCLFVNFEVTHGPSTMNYF